MINNQFYTFVYVYGCICFVYATYFTYRIYRDLFLLKDFTEFKPCSLFDNAYCGNAKELNLSVIWVNLFLLSLPRVAVFIISTLTVSIFCAIYRVYLEHYDLKPYQGNRFMWCLYAIPWAVFRFLFRYSICSTLVGCVNVEGTADPHSIVNIGFHKAFDDGFLINTLFSSFCMIIDSGALAVPFMKDMVICNDSFAFDRKDPKGRKKGLYAILHKIKEKQKNPDASIIYVFPEGYLASSNHILNFKSGAFIGLGYIQPFSIRHHNDLLTGIGSSCIRDKLIDLVLCTCKSYNFVDMIYLEPLKYVRSAHLTDLDFEINWELSYDEIVQYCEAKKEELKLLSTDYADQYTKYMAATFNQKIIEDRIGNDNEDCLYWYDYILQNHTHISQELDKLKDTYQKGYSEMGIIDHSYREKYLKNLFVTFVSEHRMDYIKRDKLTDKTHYYRSNQNILDIFYKENPDFNNGTFCGHASSNNDESKKNSFNSNLVIDHDTINLKN